MLFPFFLAILGLISAAVAAPAPAPLGVDDVIVMKTDGTSEVMKATEFDALNKASVAPARRDILPVAGGTSLHRRCDESTELQVLTDEEFTDWDIAISPVSSSSAGEVRVSVASGYSVANAVAIGETTTVNLNSATLTLMSQALSITYTTTWTTTQDQSQIFLLPEGQYGVVVSQPYVRRVTGYVYSGCTDSPVKEEFTSNTYSSASYGNLQWVKGVIRLCANESYPIPYCNGQGEHY
ncbi:hypothetical protein B0T10DRAFT_528366 [Thelonectria olida]|uniref:Uncharacterized protein n=1 Tax=Thelonectria olida TaxID=1576542 RepID=A0A9P9ASG3_9HYPO|nr:hypothetical protein B0T10DRAFT_528366 [Thelonectria olida]